MAAQQKGSASRSRKRSRRSGPPPKRNGAPNNSPPAKSSLSERFLKFFGFSPKRNEKASPSSRKRRSGKSSRPREKVPVSGTRLFVGNLSYSVKDSELSDLFESAGKVKKAEVVTRSGSNRSKGFGFVTMASVEEAQKAADLLDGKSLKGRSISVTGAKSKGKRNDSSSSGSSAAKSRPTPKAKKSTKKTREPSTRNLPRQRPEKSDRSKGQGRRRGRERSSSDGSLKRVDPMAVPQISSVHLELKQLSSDFQESDLSDLFDGIGSIVESELDEGKLRVQMDSVEEAQEAVRRLDGKDFMGEILSVVAAEK